MTELAAVPPAADGAGKNESLTEYTILGRDEEGWHVLGPYEGRNGDAAIKSAIEGAVSATAIDGWLEFVAVPSRSWVPKKVRKETVERLVVE